MKKYAIAFDMDTECLRDEFGEKAYNNAYSSIQKVLAKHNIERRQGSVYCGTHGVDEFVIFNALVELVNTYKWFGKCVNDIRVFEYEKDSDVTPLVKELYKTKYEE